MVVRRRSAGQQMAAARAENGLLREQQREWQRTRKGLVDLIESLHADGQEGRVSFKV